MDEHDDWAHWTPDGSGVDPPDPPGHDDPGHPDDLGHDDLGHDDLARPGPPYGGSGAGTDHLAGPVWHGDGPDEPRRPSPPADLAHDFAAAPHPAAPDSGAPDPEHDPGAADVTDPAGGHDGAGEPHGPNPGRLTGTDPDRLDGDAPDWAGQFPPALDLAGRPEPADGYPWIDPDALGEVGVPDPTRDADPGAAPPVSDLLSYAGLEPPGDGTDGWALLRDGDDPAAGALARWWGPPADRPAD